MAAWRYGICLLVLRNIALVCCAHSCNIYFSALEDKFRVSARPCNILHIYYAKGSRIKPFKSLMWKWIKYVRHIKLRQFQKALYVITSMPHSQCAVLKLQEISRIGWRFLRLNGKDNSPLGLQRKENGVLVRLSYYLKLFVVQKCFISLWTEVKRFIKRCKSIQDRTASVAGHVLWIRVLPLLFTSDWSNRTAARIVLHNKAITLYVWHKLELHSQFSLE